VLPQLLLAGRDCSAVIDCATVAAAVAAAVQVTNDFSFVFCAVGCHPLRPVEPESLREAVQYLAAHRYLAAAWVAHL
jgi:Tat protein secretion system quality control protein TatD with DNase activity